MATRIVADLMIPGRGEPVEHATVVLDHREITYAGPTVAAPASDSDDDVHEVPVVLPGLWDCHTHFTGMVQPNIELLGTTDVVVATARSICDAGAMLDGGVTSVRDVGGLGCGRAVNE